MNRIEYCILYIYIRNENVVTHRIRKYIDSTQAGNIDIYFFIFSKWAFHKMGISHDK